MALKDKRKLHLNVPILTRVEGEGALDIRIENGNIEHLQLKIFEPPRYFEKFLEGRHPQDVIDIVARICGICPVAYQMSAVQAIESAAGVEVTPWVKDMRRVMYCGEWLQSHSLHIHLLALPDYFGFTNVAEMATKYPDEVRRGLSLQALGNKLIALFGGRSVHPIGVRPGGFFRAPEEEDVQALLSELTTAKQVSEELIRWVNKIDLPIEKQSFPNVSLRAENEYPMNHGRLVSDGGLDIGIDEFQTHFVESQVFHSTALHCHLNGKPYLVGPLARLNNNLDRLPESTLQCLENIDVRFPSQNMFNSMMARAIEIHVAIVEALRLLSNYSKPKPSFEEIEMKAGVSFGCTEAPRGILWHRYEFDKTGVVVRSQIVPPTSQNQARMEEDLYQSLNQFGLDQPEEQLRLHSEKIVRNYDPCISCATHFLDLNLNRAKP